jgi:hypothetical protein
MRFLCIFLITILMAGTASAEKGWKYGPWWGQWKSSGGDVSDAAGQAGSGEEQPGAASESWDAYRAEAASASGGNGKARCHLDQLEWENLNSGVCDGLSDASRGLQFLCVAFCELQDCRPDYSLANPFENCATGSEWLLERYEAMRGAGDPDMPCVQAPAETGECPCWTENELAGLRGNSSPDETSLCLLNISSDGIDNLDTWQISGDGYDTIVSTTQMSVAEGSATCSLVDSCQGEECLNVNRYQTITAEQFAACEAQSNMAVASRIDFCHDFSQ